MAEQRDEFNNGLPGSAARTLAEKAADGAVQAARRYDDARTGVSTKAATKTTKIQDLSATRYRADQGMPVASLTAVLPAALLDLIEPVRQKQPQTPAPTIPANLATPPAQNRPATSAPQATSAPPAHVKPLRKSRFRRWLIAPMRVVFYGLAGYGVLCLALMVVYRFIDPPTSNLMLWQRLNGVEIERQWVPITRISPNLVQAVIASEDANFCTHSGIDIEALKLAIKGQQKGGGRGASTISMQVIKNLFLFNARSYLRKAAEIPMTLVMETLWSKRRILEIYLNIVELGDGVFGAEAASNHHFDEAAQDLSLQQASLLAVALPNPTGRDAGNPNRRMRVRARTIVNRVEGGGGRAGCVLDN